MAFWRGVLSSIVFLGGTSINDKTITSIREMAAMPNISNFYMDRTLLSHQFPEAIGKATSFNQILQEAITELNTASSLHYLRNLPGLAHRVIGKCQNEEASVTLIEQNAKSTIEKFWCLNKLLLNKNKFQDFPLSETSDSFITITEKGDPGGGTVVVLVMSRERMSRERDRGFIRYLILNVASTPNLDRNQK